MPLRSGFLASIGLRDRRRLRRVVVVELLAEVRQAGRLRAVLEALRARVGRRDARLHVVRRRPCPCRRSACASVSAAGLPPPSLSEEICDTAMSGWSSVVSTSTTFEPPSASCLIGANSAFVSVGAMSTASGFFAATALTIGVCWSGVELVRALEVQADAELLRLRLGPAVHRDVELVALARPRSSVMLYFLPLLALELEPELDEPPLSLPPHAARTSAADSRQETSTPACPRLRRVENVMREDLLLRWGCDPCVRWCDSSLVM